MNCFIFSGVSTVFPDICGCNPFDDLVSHLKRSGIENIFTDSERESSLVKRTSYSHVTNLLGDTWLAAYEGMITRQDPGDLAWSASRWGSGNAASLACSGEPWKHLTVLTDKTGSVQSCEKNPSPELARTNLCFSGLVLVKGEGFNPEKPLGGHNTSAFLVPGYWNILSDRESYLLAAHHILSGRVSPWPGAKPVVLNSAIPQSCSVSGTLWVGEGCSVGENCVMENCVIMDHSVVGGGSFLRNCLVSPGASVRPGTLIEDKYLTFLGEL